MKHVEQITDYKEWENTVKTIRIDVILIFILIDFYSLKQLLYGCTIFVQYDL
jgi:hypothetical protein